MKHSIFWKIIIGLLVVIILVDSAWLMFLYKNTYEHELDEATEKIKVAASTVALALEGFDPDYPDEYSIIEDYLNNMCDAVGITYLYALKPYIETRDEMYLVRGYGKNASEEYINNR